MSNKLRDLLRLLAAIVLAGAVMSEAFGDLSADELRESCEAATKCVDIRESCVSRDVTGWNICVSYISGFREGHDYGVIEGLLLAAPKNMPPNEIFEKYRLICVPSAATNMQLARVFLKYVDDRPENLHRPASEQVYESWEGAFSCK